MVLRSHFVVELQEKERGPYVFADITTDGLLTTAYGGRPGVKFTDANSAERFRQLVHRQGIQGYSILTSKVREIGDVWGTQAPKVEEV